MASPRIGSRWRRRANGKIATVLSVRESEGRLVLKFDDSRILYTVAICNDRPCAYEPVEEEAERG